MYCVYHSPDDDTRAVVTAMNTDGDSGSIGAITGSAKGARLGLAAVPPKWRDTILLRNPSICTILAKGNGEIGAGNTA